MLQPTSHQPLLFLPHFARQQCPGFDASQHSAAGDFRMQKVSKEQFWAQTSVPSENTILFTAFFFKAENCPPEESMPLFRSNCPLPPIQHPLQSLLWHKTRNSEARSETLDLQWRKQIIRNLEIRLFREVAASEARDQKPECPQNTGESTHQTHCSQTKRGNPVVVISSKDHCD